MATRGAGELAVIRRAFPDEWAAVRQVRLEALAEAPYAFSSTLERESGFGEQIWRQRLASAATFLAWRGDVPIGTATGLAADPAEQYAVPGSWDLVGMWVDPGVRGQRIADKLVEAVAEEARKGGATVLALWVTDVNVRARAFYERIGFRSTGTRQPVRPEEPDLWEEQMLRDLAVAFSGPLS